MTQAPNHAWYKPIFYWLQETAACCYFGVDLGNGLNHNSLSRLADGTSYSSSDLPYFTPLLPFYLDKLFQVQLPFSILIFGQKFSKCNSSSLFSSDKSIPSPTSILQKNSKTILNSVSRKIIPISQNYSKSHFLSDLEKIPLFCLPISYSCRWSLSGIH